MAVNNVVPIRERILDRNDEVVGFSDKFRQTPEMASLVARGVLPVEYLEGEVYRGCTEATHVRDVLMAEGYYARPAEILDWDDEVVEGKEALLDEWKQRHDRRRKAARERVKKRRQRC